MGATSVLVTNQAQTFIWVGHGLKLHIPQGALPAGLKECRLFIKVGLSDQFALPQNTFLVSAVYFLDSEPRCTFSQPITVEIQHCVKTTYTSSLSFVHAKCFQTDLPYVFNTVKGGDFSSFSQYGCLQLDHCFSHWVMGVVCNGTENNSMLAETALLQYCASLYYLKKDLEREIHIVITRGQEAVSSEPLCSYCCSLLSHAIFIQVVQRRYTAKNATVGPALPVEFEAETISLQLPPIGIYKDGWKIILLQNQMVGCTAY